MLKKTGMASATPPRRQRGAAAVEFALIALVFFTLLLGIIEFGRLLYLWNTVQEVTRKAAREAVVRWIDDRAAIKREAIFRGGTSGAVALPAGPELTDATISIRYLSSYNPSTGVGVDASPEPTSAADNLGACLDGGRSSSCIRFVEAKVCAAAESGCNPVQYVPLVGLFPFLAINIPDSTVVMPAESLGLSP